jgi:hypothetical protein
MQRTWFERAKSVAGAVLVAVGMFILYQHLDRAVSQLLGAPGGPLGALPTSVFAASRFVQSYATDHQRFLENLVKQILISAWPLLLVMVGTVLSRDGFADQGDAIPKKRL